MSEEKGSKVFSKKVLIVGGRGTVGSCIITQLYDFKIYGYDTIKLDITIAGSSDQGKEVTVNNKKYKYIQIDMSKSDSIKKALTDDKYDWLIACGGGAPMGPMTAHTIDSFRNAFNSKGFGQIDLAMQGNKLLNNDGSIVLTTGYLDRFGVKGVSGLSAVNGMLNGFIKSAGLETERGITLNTVSPGLLTESKDAYGPFLPAQPLVDGKDVAQAYVRALLSGKTGNVFEVLSPQQWNENAC